MREPRDFLVATYRLQLHAGFDFDAAAAVVPHLARLGISHVYLSPILEAAAGSTHGYDVVDHGMLSTALGGAAGFARLIATLRAHEMRVLLDIVPNHMSIAGSRNRWWWEVLENGPSARAAAMFDVDWDPPEHKLRNVLLVPVLGAHRGEVLAKHEITIARAGAAFTVRYFEHRLPIAPRTVGQILHETCRRISSDSLAFLADAYAELPSPTTLDTQSVERRHRDRAVLQGLLATLLASSPEISSAVDLALNALNHDIDALDAFLDRQNYRLAYWRNAERDLDYRRFFDINTLVGLRVEDPRVFAATHALVTDLVRTGQVAGLRVDHVDGLAEPAVYLRRLREAVGDAPIFVEKILAPNETLPDWPVDGSTGYEFLNELTALFIDPGGERSLFELNAEFTSDGRTFDEIATEARRQVLDEILDSDVTRLTAQLANLCERYRSTRDYTRHDVREALLALLATLSVYRTYSEPSTDTIRSEDIAQIEQAIARAHALRPDVDLALFNVIADVVLLRCRGDDEAAFVRRFQQMVPAAVAKGIEDTAFYRYTPLVALNEVGGSPTRFSLTLDEFHAHNRRAQAEWPSRLLTTSTHDTKRSEDVRARLVLLAQDADAFSTLARSFFTRSGRHWSGTPDPTMTMLVLQTLIGAWPIDAERLRAYAEKAGRETKRATSWTRPNADYERMLCAFCDAILVDTDLTAEVEQYVAAREARARAVSIGWTLLKLTCPGTPDFYQGSELWQHDLVDPDNRRPVDWPASAAALERDEALPSLEADGQGLTKLRVIRRALMHRRTHPENFDHGATYEAISVAGDRVVAFSRRARSGAVSVTIVPRFGMMLDDTRLVLPRGRFIDVLGDLSPLEGEIALLPLLHRLPVMLLHAEAS